MTEHYIFEDIDDVFQDGDGVPLNARQDGSCRPQGLPSPGSEPKRR